MHANPILRISGSKWLLTYLFIFVFLTLVQEGIQLKLPTMDSTPNLLTLSCCINFYFYFFYYSVIFFSSATALKSHTYVQLWHIKMCYANFTYWILCLLTNHYASNLNMHILNPIQVSRFIISWVKHVSYKEAF